MDLFSLAARLTLDSSQYEKGVRGATAEGKSLANRLSTTLTKATKVVSVAAGAAFTAASATIVKVGKEAFSEYANLEQSLGGSEAVFQEYAGVVQESSKTAFKQAGMSMDEYLSYANKIGSLLQGSGFSEGEAADQAMQVMQRAADVASIMGVDVTTAMDAITGAAKGNFTMMDNLGVAMNATTLEAYALSKGITTSYSDMSQAQKVGLAYQKFLEDTQQYAGNYEKENTTLAGSVTSLQAAWKNFLSGSGSAEDVGEMLDLVFDAYSNAAETLMPHITEGLGTLISMVSDRLPELIAKIMPVIVTTATNMLKALPHILWGAAVGVANGIIEAINSAFGTNFPKIEKVEMPTWADISEAATGVLNGIIDGINGVFDLNIPHISEIKIPTWADIQTAAVRTLNWIIYGINHFLGTNIPAITEIGIPSWTDISSTAGQIITAIITGLNGLLNPADGGISLDLSGKVSSALDGVLTWLSGDGPTDTVNSILSTIGTLLSGAITIKGNAALSILDGILTNLSSEEGAQKFTDIMIKIGDGLGSAIGELAAAATQIVGKFVDYMLNDGGWEKLGQGLITIFTGVTTGIDVLMQKIIDKVQGNDKLSMVELLQKRLVNDPMSGQLAVPIEFVLNQDDAFTDKEALAQYLQKLGVISEYTNENGKYKYKVDSDYDSGETQAGVAAQIEQDIALAKEAANIPTDMEAVTQAVMSSIEQASASTGTAAQGATNDVNGLNDALAALPDSKEVSLYVNTKYNGELPFGLGVDGSHAKGLYNVPYDGYVAELHRGEQVVMAGNANRDSGMDIGAMASAIAGAVAAALSNLTVQMDGETVGNMVTDYVADNVSTAARGKRFAL